MSAALDAHGPEEAGKFIEEVFWRSYLNGHLETRPAIWTRYDALVAEGKDRIASQSGLRRAYESAVTGSTGIDGFDDWARELTDTGWLHNHARMLFATVRSRRVLAGFGQAAHSAPIKVIAKLGPGRHQPHPPFASSVQTFTPTATPRVRSEAGWYQLQMLLDDG